jgi:hypothetical protein
MNVTEARDDAQELAASLARDAQLGAPVAIEPLVGGRNNRVFRVEFAGMRRAVLKWYHADPHDRRDRLRAEWNFLAYVRTLGVQNVPRPLAIRAESRAALYSFVPGARTPAVTDALNRQAAKFAVAINAKPAAEAALEPASEACFSLADHLATVNRRVMRLDQLDIEAPGLEAVHGFVRGRLQPAWQAVKTAIEQAALERGVPLAKPIDRPVVSPSDFGFHNALIDSGGDAVFIDFEYAGRDDPAKLICDYFCQPERPVPAAFYRDFVSNLASGLGLSDEDLWRAPTLFAAYRVKWVCIMLNEFSRLGARRRSFAGAERATAGAIACRLREVDAYLRAVHP